jgi:hypothetical protein
MLPPLMGEQTPIRMKTSTTKASEGTFLWHQLEWVRLELRPHAA